MQDFIYDLPPENYYFGGGGSTLVTPLAIVVFLLAGVVLLAFPRRYAIIAFLVAGILIPLNAKIVAAGLHLDANRLLLLIGLVRLFIRHEWFPDRLNSLDRTVLYLALVNAICYVLVWREYGAVVNRMGFLFRILGTYFLLRAFIRTKDDVIQAIKVFAWIVIFIAPLMIYEHISQHNYFSVVGSPAISLIRNGRVRAQGPFAHSIVAGTFGVVLIPLFVGLGWEQARYRLLASIAIISSIGMMFASSSSTPALAFPAAVLALCAWPLRDKMRLVRYFGIGVLLLIQLTMSQPVWFLMNRASGVLGGSGWHRAMLVDNFVRHFFDWFLIGTRDNPNWGWSMWDVDNAYVSAGFTGGLLGFILFLKIFVLAYGMVGRAWRAAGQEMGEARLIWALGAALFANMTGFFGIIYWDQSIVGWYALLVMISAASVWTSERPATVPRPEV